MFYYTSYSIRQLPLRTKIFLSLMLIAAIAGLIFFGLMVFVVVTVVGLLSFLVNLLGGRTHPTVPPNPPRFQRPAPRDRHRPSDDDIIDI